MDQVAMISWLSKSTFRSASCPPPTIEVKKKKSTHSLLQLPLQLSGWLCDSVIDNEIQGESCSRNFENANNLPNKRDKRRGSSLLPVPSSCF